MRVVLNSRRSSLPRESAEVTGAESPLLSSSLLSYPLRSDFFLIRAQGRERKRERVAAAKHKQTPALLAPSLPHDETGNVLL